MKAVRLHAYGDVDQLVYEDVPDPQPGPGQIVVQVAASSVNPIDFKVMSGAMKQQMPLELPAILGHDAAGTVQQVGSGVSRFRVGDRVAAVTGAAYAERVVDRAEVFARVPDALELADAGALPLVTMTGTLLIEDGLRVQPRERVLVTGAHGNVGRSAVRAAKDAGTFVIAGVRAGQMDGAKQTGADSVVSLEDDAALARLEPLDAVADTVGGPVADKLLPRIKDGGRLVTVVMPPGRAAEFPRVKVQSYQMHADGALLERLLQTVADGKLKIPIARRFRLSQAREAVRLARGGGAGKVLLLP